MRGDARLLAILATASLCAVFAACSLGTTPIGPMRAAAGLLGLGAETDRIVLQEIRLPRALAAFVTGGALAISGAALQGLLRNPLAEPGVLGVTAASSFAATLTIAFGIAAQLPLALPVAAIGAALAATLGISAIAYRTRSVVTLILIGVAVSSFIGALMSLVLSLAPNPFTMAELVNWSFGSVANRSWRDLAISVPGIALGGAILMATRRGLTVLTLGEAAAEASGLDLARHRRGVVIGAGLATGASVALAGAIGFVGIIAPHAIRPLVGHDPARLLLPAFLFGGLALVLADIVIRVLPTQADLRLGVAAALIGAPIFAVIAARRAGF